MDMPAIDLAIFLAATFVGAVVSGVAGFAFGLVVAGMWLHFLPPLVVAILISGFGIILQSTGIWKLRHALNWKILWPFLVSGAIGVPLGVAILGVANPLIVRCGIGVLLVLYSAYALARPALAPIRGPHTAVDFGVGFLNGVLGGMTGLTGVIITVWSGLRGWPKDEQRAIFQPVIMAMFLMTALWLGASRTVPPQAITLFLTGVPVLLAGVWLGLRLYGRLDEAGFRRIVLVLLLVSGALLIAGSFTVRGG
jgi:uncharacterized membrane protein YfcA